MWKKICCRYMVSMFGDEEWLKVCHHVCWCSHYGIRFLSWISPLQAHVPSQDCCLAAQTPACHQQNNKSNNNNDNKVILLFQFLSNSICSDSGPAPTTARSCTSWSSPGRALRTFTCLTRATTRITAPHPTAAITWRIDVDIGVTVWSVHPQSWEIGMRERRGRIGGRISAFLGVYSSWALSRDRPRPLGMLLLVMVVVVVTCLCLFLNVCAITGI